MVPSFIALQVRVILEGFVSVFLSLGVHYFTMHSLGALFTPYAPLGKHWMFCVLENTSFQEGIIERVNLQCSTFTNDILPRLLFIYFFILAIHSNLLLC